ncbi:MAG TPA: hypothetical protein VFW27_28765 [Actinoplanes sp.]|jgi:hypothetical protein|nr:hypothetical protein [Actinoplanes sp.]
MGWAGWLLTGACAGHVVGAGDPGSAAQATVAFGSGWCGGWSCAPP